jgi:hypothetical protein
MPWSYAGVLDRPGSNAALQLVDERIVGRKPAMLDHAAADYGAFGTLQVRFTT